MSEIPITQPTLLLRIRDTEDEASWERFVKIYTPLVFGYCRKRGLQEADASDVAQEVMRTVAQLINRFEYAPSEDGSSESLATSSSNISQSSKNNPSGAAERPFRQNSKKLQMLPKQTIGITPTNRDSFNGHPVK